MVISKISYFKHSHTIPSSYILHEHKLLKKLWVNKCFCIKQILHKNILCIKSSATVFEMMVVCLCSKIFWKKWYILIYYLLFKTLIEDDEKPQILISEALLTKLVLYLFSLHTWHSTNKIHNKVTDNIYSVDHKWFLQVIFKENSIPLLNKNQIITSKKNKISI